MCLQLRRRQTKGDHICVLDADASLGGSRSAGRDDKDKSPAVCGNEVGWQVISKANKRNLGQNRENVGCWESLPKRSRSQDTWMSLYSRKQVVGRGVVSGPCGWKIRIMSPLQASIQRPEQPHPRVTCLLLCTDRRCASLGRKNGKIYSSCTVI